MKRYGALLPLLFASAAMAGQIDTLNGDNLIGLNRIESAAEYLPLGVVYGAAGADEAAPAADQFVFTGGLEPGDALYVYDRAGAQYRVFELERTAAGDEWQPRRVVQVAGGQFEAVVGAAAADTALAPGYGAWLYRPGAASRTNQTVLAGGQVRTAKFSVELVAAVDGKAFGRTLIAVPAAPGGKFALNGGAIDWAGAAAGDEIRVPQIDGSQQAICYDGEKWVRRYYVVVNGVKRLRTDNDPTLPAGTAVWYARKAGAGAMAIEWGEP